MNIKFDSLIKVVERTSVQFEKSYSKGILYIFEFKTALNVENVYTG